MVITYIIHLVLALTKHFELEWILAFFLRMSSGVDHLRYSNIGPMLSGQHLGCDSILES